MADDKEQGGAVIGSTPRRAPAKGDRRKPKPEWTSGLKQIYDSVVNEPIPDNFADLLARLDDEDR